MGNAGDGDKGGGACEAATKMKLTRDANDANAVELTRMMAGPVLGQVEGGGAGRGWGGEGY